MFKVRKLKAGNKYVFAVWVKLQNKNFLLFRGEKGYIMCGYLNLNAAKRFNDAAVKIVGVSSIGEALKAKVHSFTGKAGAMGVYKGQPVREVLRLIA